MSMIRVKHLTFSYPTSEEKIFEDVNLHLDTEWKLGLIGRNGRGKTTFLQLLLGKYEHKGKIQASVEFDYFPAPVRERDRNTMEVLSEICPAAEEWHWLRELSLLEVSEEVLYRPFSTLSHGEQTKVLLAGLFLKEGCVALIDEPTNHLDRRGREIVAAYLKRKKGFILVSHDRSFLDGCVDHILAINRSSIELQRGNFSSWLSNFEAQQESELARNKDLKKSISQMKKAAQRTTLWSDRVEASKFGNGPVDRGYIGGKSAKMMKRAKSIALRQQRAIEEKASLLKDVETAEELKLTPLSYRSGTLVTFSEVAPRVRGKEICRPLPFPLREGSALPSMGRMGLERRVFSSSS